MADTEKKAPAPKTAPAAKKAPAKKPAAKVETPAVEALVQAKGHESAASRRA